jgi:hypothetical protein
VQSIDTALSKLEKDGSNTDKLLDRFKKIGISAIPLRENFCAKEMPGAVELLTQIAERELTVNYVELKYK